LALLLALKQRLYERFKIIYGVNNMILSRFLLSIIGRRFPSIYDVIPRGPLSRLSQVALNPQPLPPHELGAALASEFVQVVWQADRFGFDQGVVFDDLDDWCPTRPKKIKLPPWWPPIPEPEPHPEWLIDFHLGFAARLAVTAEAFEGSRFSESVNKAMDRSLEAIEGMKQA
jgi:hypothetical protein